MLEELGKESLAMSSCIHHNFMMTLNYIKCSPWPESGDIKRLETAPANSKIRQKMKIQNQTMSSEILGLEFSITRGIDLSLRSFTLVFSESLYHKPLPSVSISSQREIFEGQCLLRLKAEPNVGY